MNGESTEVVVRDSISGRWIGSVYYGARRGWTYEAYDGSGRNIDGYESCSQALDALLDYLS